MQLFKTDKEWNEVIKNKRICLAYRTGLAEDSLKFALKQNQFTKSEKIFLINFGRNFSENLCQDVIEGDKVELLIHEPNDLDQFMDAMNEISVYAKNSSKRVTTIINDWETIWYLFQNSFNTIGLPDLLMQLKFLSDYTNIYIIHKADNKTCKVLDDWYSLCLQLESKERLHIVYSAFADYVIDAKINLALLEKKQSSSQATPQPVAAKIEEVKEEQSEEPNPEVKKSQKAPLPKNKFMPAPDNSLFENMQDRLGSARTKEELLKVRQEIQTKSDGLTVDEKNELSEAYKLHLQRIKLLEERITEDSLPVAESIA